MNTDKLPVFLGRIAELSLIRQNISSKFRMWESTSRSEISIDGKTTAINRNFILREEDKTRGNLISALDDRKRFHVYFIGSLSCQM